MNAEQFINLDVALTIIGLKSKIEEYHVKLAEAEAAGFYNISQACSNALQTTQCLLDEALALAGDGKEQDNDRT